MRTIRVTGKGQLKIHPDMTVITVDLKGRYPNYDETLRRSAEDTEKLKDILAQLHRRGEKESDQNDVK